jgi:small subunit ribosomal protein S21
VSRNENFEETPSCEVADAPDSGSETDEILYEPDDLEDMGMNQGEVDQEDRNRRTGSLRPGEAIMCRPLEVKVFEGKMDKAIRMLKNRLAKEGVLKEIKRRRHYSKPSEQKRIKARDAARRRRKAQKAKR